MRIGGMAPRWASPPGETIASAMLELNMQAPELAQKLGVSLQELNGLFAGVQSITLSVARALSSVVGGSVDFWMARDAQYLDDRERVLADSWAGKLPVKKMVDLGWIVQPGDWLDQIDACKRFFSVNEVSEYDERYGRLISQAQYRLSDAHKVDSFAAASWFRSCEIAADKLKLSKKYNPISFERALDDIRRLTLAKDPKYFVPKLVDMCASSGVAVVLVRAPQGFAVSGATRQYKGRPLVQLSARHLVDDQLWFTFFHESGHVLLHDLTVPFMDTDEVEGSESIEKQEQEANEFARQKLTGEFDVHNGPQSYNAVLEVATKLGIAPGIVVGQLQHAGKVPAQNLNRLKRRYSWNGPNLEMARKT